jgi:hypothetical protein
MPHRLLKKQHCQANLMPKRKSAARASIQNLREANKKRQKKGKQNPHQENEHWPKAAVPSITTSEFSETETGDAPDLDPDLREWCERQDISMGQVVDEDGNDTNSDLSSSEDRECLDSFEEITEQSELKLFSIFLKKAQGVTSEVQNTGTSRRTYKGNSRSTKYRQKKIRDDLISKGFLPIDQFMERMKKRKLTISDSEPPSSCSVSSSGVSAQACTFQEEEEESDLLEIAGLEEHPRMESGPPAAEIWVYLAMGQTQSWDMSQMMLCSCGHKGQTLAVWGLGAR